MSQLILIGVGAGAAAALLFVSVTSASAFALVLACLAPLPILIAALGWSHWSALIAALFGALCLAVLLGPSLFLAFIVRVGLPAWWLGYLALLARPAVDPAQGQVEWYPVGRLVLWSALLAAAVVMALLLSLGSDEQSIHAGLREAVERFFRALSRTPAGSPLDLGPRTQAIIELAAATVPPGIAVSLTIINLVNLWLAARVVNISGRLRRPLPDLTAIRMPAQTLLVLGGAIIAAFLPGLIGLAGAILAAALLMAFAVVGFAVLHAITIRMSGRLFFLASVYILVLLLSWPVLAVSLLGLADAAFDIRGWAARRHRPPPPPTRT